MAGAESRKDLPQDVLAALQGLTCQDLELALRRLDAHPPECWDGVLEALTRDAAGTPPMGTAQGRRQASAAWILLHVCGGRIGTRYAATRKPRLERPLAWSALLACHRIQDKALGRDLRDALPRCLHHAGPLFPSLVPSLLQMLNAEHRSMALAILQAAGAHGCDLSLAENQLGAILPEGAAPLVFVALDRGDVEEALRLFRLAPEPRSLAADVGLRVGPEGDGPYRELLMGILDYEDPLVRAAAVQSLGRRARPDPYLVRRLLEVDTGLHGAEALARLSARDPEDGSGALAALRATWTRGGAGRHGGAWGLMVSALLRGDGDQAVALLEAPDADTRRGALAGLARGAHEAEMPLSIRLLDCVECLREREGHATVREAVEPAVEELARHLSRSTEGAGPLRELALRRWARAAELSVHDDPRVLEGVARLARASVASDPRALPSLLLLARVCLARLDLKGAAAAVDKGLALAPDDPGVLGLEALVAEGDPRRARERVLEDRPWFRPL